MKELETRLPYISLPTMTLLLGLLASTTVAGQQDPAQPPPSEKASESGLRAYLDPETGELTSSPSPAQAEILQEAFELSSSSLSNENLRSFDLRSGGRGLFLAGRFQSSLVMSWSENGAHEFHCVEGYRDDDVPNPIRKSTEWAEK